VEDGPDGIAEILTGLARRIGAPAPYRAPAWLARLLAGELAISQFTSSTRTSNARFRRDVGWAPRYPTIREGLDQVVATWLAEGFLSHPRAASSGGPVAVA
jgi:2-alkyl-3-oxoalkanoate reductase